MDQLVAAFYWEKLVAVAIEQGKSEVVLRPARALRVVVDCHSYPLAVESFGVREVDVLKCIRSTVLSLRNVFVSFHAAFVTRAGAFGASLGTIAVPLPAATHHLNVKVGARRPLEVDVHAVSLHSILAFCYLHYFLYCRTFVHPGDTYRLTFRSLRPKSKR